MSISGRYSRTDNGEESFFLVKLNLHTADGKKLRPYQIRESLAFALEQTTDNLQEEIDFTIEVAKYYDKEGD